MATSPLTKHELHLLRHQAGHDQASQEREVIALFTSLYGRPPNEREIAALRDEMAKP